MFQDFFIYIILGALTVLIGFLAFLVFGLRRRVSLFFRGGENLESVLASQIKKLEKQEKDLKKILERIKKLEKIAQISFQKIGVVRFNPFGEIGGAQSFSIALLDAQNSGFVITSLFSREGNRVFAKPVKQGKSEYSLSGEEIQAIKKAMKT